MEYLHRDELHRLMLPDRLRAVCRPLVLVSVCLVRLLQLVLTLMRQVPQFHEDHLHLQCFGILSQYGLVLSLVFVG